MSSRTLRKRKVVEKKVEYNELEETIIEDEDIQNHELQMQANYEDQENILLEPGGEETIAIRNKKHLRKDAEDDNYGQNYFQAHRSKFKRSESTLRNVDFSGIVSQGSTVESKHGQELNNFYERKFFKKWFLMMSENFNIVLYGLGSKKNILEKFSELWLSDERTLLISGFISGLNFKMILYNFQDALNSYSSDEACILEAASKMKHHLFIVIHSLDILLANLKRMKAFLLKLVLNSRGKVHFICSTDHVHSGLLFNAAENCDLRLIWIAAHTYNSYNLERAYFRSDGISENNSRNMSAHLTLSSIQHVYDSLTPNAKNIFLVIINYYLDHKKVRRTTRKSAIESKESDDDDGDEEESVQKPQPEFEGLAFTELYRRSREEFLVNSETTLRTQLVEFTDHKLVRFQKASDGGEMVHLIITLRLAQKFLNKLKDVTDIDDEADDDDD